MADALSSNTKAILLLTAPLLVGRAKRSQDLLAPREYKQLARHLRKLEREPSDLLASDSGKLIEDCSELFDRDRLGRLLARGFLLSQAAERWQSRAIWVVSRADGAYPKRVKSRLREDSPAVLYGCGDRRILDAGGLAVVGSRNVDEALIEYTMSIGRLVALSQQALVSGGARGIDQAAMRGALDEGGRVSGVLADRLEKTALNREHRNLILNGQLVLVSPYDPTAGFNVGNAMQRNKLIYALADASLVVSSDVDKGGTWAGAQEQLKKLFFVPVYVRSTGVASEGLEALKRIGARPWPNPTDAEELSAALSAPAAMPSRPSGQTQLPFSDEQESDQAPPVAERSPEDPGGAADTKGNPKSSEHDSADALFQTVRLLVTRYVAEPRKADEVADELAVTRRQAQDWLKRLVDEGAVKKVERPVRYVSREVR